jgi:hypothetical protein
MIIGLILSLEPDLGISASRAPARNLRFDNFVGFEITPGVLEAATWKRNDIGSVVIDAKKFGGRSVARKSIDDELGDPIVQ